MSANDPKRTCAGLKSCNAAMVCYRGVGGAARYLDSKRFQVWSKDDLPTEVIEMKRREFITLIGGAIVACTFPAIAQEAGRTYRVGILFPFPLETDEAVGTITALSDGLRRQGFIEGQNLAIDYRAWAPHIDLTSVYAAEMVKGRPDVIVVGGPAAVRAAQQATKTIPLVAITDDMVGEGVVSSMARPTGNTTGVSILSTELDGKRQEILIEAVPGLRRMAALADSNTTAIAQLNALQEAARARNIELSILPIAKGEEIAAAIEKAKASGAAGLNVLASPMLYSNRHLILERVAAQRLPAIYQFAEIAEEGGFTAYGPRLTQIMSEILARQLIQLLRGSKVADIPVEQPTKFELVINLKTADAVGVAVPAGLVARADKVIQ
jgi:putative ABC transport system substrate-binding protein